jgi:RNA polymerase sigma-70 factor (ECF subfamily)
MTASDPESALASESDLVRRLRAGEEAACDELVRSHGPRMLQAARRILGGDEDAEDAVQEAFFQGFRGLGEFAGTCRIGTWLHRIAINCALMRLRARRRRPEASIEELLPTFTADGHQARPVRWESPAAASESDEVRGIVRRRIGELPESYRTVIVLRDLEGLDTEETARLLDITPNAVKVRLHRARQALKTLLDPDLGSVH